MCLERAVTGSGNTGDALAIEALAALVRAHPELAERLQEKIANNLQLHSIGQVRRTIDVSPPKPPTQAAKHELNVLTPK